MTEVPKIVYDRLRAAPPERATLGQTVRESVHPDADLLTAFAERALSAAERDGVLQHLALCRDCREVIALAHSDASAAAAPTTAGTESVRAPVPAKSRWSWLSSPKLAWPSLGWAALAAGVALAASVLLLHPGKLKQATLSSANRRVAPSALPAGPQTTSAPGVSSPGLLSPTASAPTTSLSANQFSVPPNAASVKTRAMQTKPELGPSKKIKAVPPLAVQPGMMLADNRKASIPGHNRAAVPSPAASAFRSEEPGSRNVTQNVEVAGAAVGVAVAPSPENTLMAQNTAPAIEKAKPPLPETAVPETTVNESQKTAGVAASPEVRLYGRDVMSAGKRAPSSSQPSAPNVAWTITAGVLQRSQDSGQSWQNALRADHPLLCYATRGAEIWAGGQAGTLFRSADNGLTWVRVQPSIKSQTLTSDITHVDILGPMDIVLSINNDESWSSKDGGKTWAKK